jgi:hypothetical protein
MAVMDRLNRRGVTVEADSLFESINAHRIRGAHPVDVVSGVDGSATFDTMTQGDGGRIYETYDVGASRAPAVAEALRQNGFTVVAE